MYAILRTGNKQYKVKAGDVIRVEKLPKDLGTEFDLTDVLFVGGEQNFLGEPVLEKARVTVVVTNQSRDAKVIVFKKRRRQGYRRLRGHRQSYTELFVKAIVSPDGKRAQADQEPKIFSPERREARLEERQVKSKQDRVARKSGKSEDAPEAKVAKKKTAKKVAKKAGKKKVARKATKSTAKKAAKK